MLKLTVVDNFRDRQDLRFGSEPELCRYVIDKYLPSAHGYNLDRLLAELNKGDQYHAEVHPHEPGPEENRLPEDYQTANQADAPDPWPRRGEPEPW